MKREVKKQWLKDLRSGAYKQGRRTLAAALGDGTVGHCCLGVLVDGAARPLIEGTGNKIVEPHKYEIDSPALLGISYGDGYLARHSIPLHLLPVVGLTQKQQTRLMAMNDMDGKDFKQIANWISRNVPAED